MSNSMTKGAETKYIDQRFEDHNSWIKSIEIDHKDTQKRVTAIETSHAGMAEAIKGLAEDMKEFKTGLQAMAKTIEQSSKDTNARLLWGFLGVISTGVIVGIIIYLTK